MKSGKKEKYYEGFTWLTSQNEKNLQKMIVDCENNFNNEVSYNDFINIPITLGVYWSVFSVDDGTYEVEFTRNLREVVVKITNIYDNTSWMYDIVCNSRVKYMKLKVLFNRDFYQAYLNLKKIPRFNLTTMFDSLFAKEIREECDVICVEKK